MNWSVPQFLGIYPSHINSDSNAYPNLYGNKSITFSSYFFIIKFNSNFFGKIFVFSGYINGSDYNGIIHLDGDYDSHKSMCKWINSAIRGGETCVPVELCIFNGEKD